MEGQQRAKTGSAHVQAEDFFHATEMSLIFGSNGDNVGGHEQDGNVGIGVGVAFTEIGRAHRGAAADA